jgi:hypothetical protein
LSCRSRAKLVPADAVSPSKEQTAWTGKLLRVCFPRGFVASGLISACRGGKPRNDGFGGQSGSGFVAKNRQILTLIRHSGNEANFPE